jgi:hypothetical protein
MNISGPLSVSAVNTPHQRAPDLRPFQRVTAQVLSVTGTTALLTIEGFPIVAQLASVDQAATLLPQQTAQFIVTQRTSEKITLKVIRDDPPQASLAPAVLHGSEVAVRLLEQQNIPLTANHLIIARAVLKKHLPVTPMLLNELSETLSGYGSWGAREAEVAAALKAAGLLLNTESLALASRQAAQTGESLARLIAGLAAMSRRDLPEEMLKQLDSSLQLLRSLVLKVDSKPSQLAEQLKTAVEMLGRSLENAVFEQMQNAETFADHNLLPLVRFQQSLEQAGKNELAGAISDFLKDLQRNEFLNTKPDPVPGQGEWIEIGFALERAQQKANELFSSTRLRIARQPGNASAKINPAYTRLVLQVDLSQEQTVEVDLSMIDKQIRALVMAPDVSWCRQAQEEFPTLEQALQDLGFTLKDAQIGVGEPQSLDRSASSGDLHLMTIDIEA